MCNKEELPQQWKESIIIPFCKKGDTTDCNNYRGISFLSTANKILSNIFLARLTPYLNKIIGIIRVGTVVTDLLSIRISTFGRY
jgi:hypothetical protein